MHGVLKICLTAIEKGQRQNEELQDVSETLTTLQQEIAEKDEQLSNKDAVINLLRLFEDTVANSGGHVLVYSYIATCAYNTWPHNFI